MTELTVDEKRRWKEFRESVDALCTTEREKKRVGKEFALFEERGWENYILLMKDIMKAMNPESGLCVQGGSVCDSYALEKYRTGETGELRLLLNEKGRQILFNDALRMNYVLENPDSLMMEKIRNLDDVLDPIVLSSGLFKAQRLYEDTTNDPAVARRMVEFLVLSNEPIDEDDMDLIANETRNSTPEEAGRLREYLIVKIRADFLRAPGWV